jgi:hypothetical protein
MHKNQKFVLVRFPIRNLAGTLALMGHLLFPTTSEAKYKRSEVGGEPAIIPFLRRAQRDFTTPPLRHQHHDLYITTTSPTTSCLLPTIIQCLSFHHLKLFILTLLPYKLAYKTPLRYKTPSHIVPPLEEGRCPDICWHIRPPLILVEMKLFPYLITLRLLQ